MIVTLTNENSQSVVNEKMFEIIKKVCAKYGHEAYNYGPYAPDDDYMIYYHETGLLNAILINSGASDLALTACGTGEGVLIATNAFPGVECGYVADEVDARLVREINQVNAVAMGFGKYFSGFSSDLKFERVLEQLLDPDLLKHDMYMPADDACFWLKDALGEMKRQIHPTMMELLHSVDRKLLKNIVKNPRFEEQFFATCKNAEIAEFMRSVIEG